MTLENYVLQTVLSGTLCSGCFDSNACTLLRPAIWWSHELRLLSVSEPSLCSAFDVEQTTCTSELDKLTRQTLHWPALLCLTQWERHQI